MPQALRFVRTAAWALGAACLAIAGSLPGTRPLDFKEIRDEDRLVLKGDTDGRVATAPLLGPVDPYMPMEHMILGLRMAPEARTRLDELLAAQQDPASPDYHRWLTPQAFAQRFAPSAADRQVVVQWLESQGFRVEEVTQGGLAIVFSGNAAMVASAFRTSMEHVVLDGVRHFANVTEPSVPRALAAVVQGVVSLHDLPLPHAHAPLGTAPIPANTSGTTHAIVPGDFARIYNIQPLYAAGLDGTGQTVAVVGRCNINLSDVRTFRSSLGLPARDPVVIVNGTNPGNLGGNEEVEACLDVQWAGGIARNATVKFVVSPSGSSDGVYLSTQYVINSSVAPVMTISFGLCESLLGASANTWINNLYSQAAAQGITVCVSSGDYGSSGCYPNGNGTAVSGLASTLYNVCVGGTQFSEGSGTYWAASNNADLSSALGYIPEVVWNQGSGGTGGGSSTLYAKPSWQAAPGVPADGTRDVPDVAFTSATHDAYLIYMASRGGWVHIGGTSAATPAFAGLVSLLVQRTGKAMGNLLPGLYKLGNAQYAARGAAVFHDITSGNNALYGAGYSAGTGYDCATGLGSMDANAWLGTFPGVTLTAGGVSPNLVGSSVTFTAAGAGGSGSYEYQFQVKAPGGAFVVAKAYSASPTFTWATTGLKAGAYTIKACLRLAGTAPADGCDAAATLPFTLNAVTAVTATLKASMASPQSAGQGLTFTAAAAGGTGTFEYQFWLQAPGGDYVSKQAYSSAATFAWTTTGLAAGTYNVSVWVRSVGSTAAKDVSATLAYVITVPKVTLKASVVSPQKTGVTVTWTAAGTAGSGTYEYQFYVQAPGGSAVVTQAYGAAATFAWKTTGLKTGTYTVTVWLRNKGTSPAGGSNASAATTYALQ